jgi:hypothetical protein
MWRSGWREEMAMPCDSMTDQELVSQAVRIRRQLQHLDKSHEDIQQRLTAPMNQAEDGQLGMTQGEITLGRQREELWKEQRHLSKEIDRRGLYETVVQAGQADDARRKQEGHDE